MIKELIPLFQTGLWVTLIGVIVIFTRKEIRSALEILTKRLEAGNAFKAGPFEMSELKSQLKTVRQEVADINNKAIELFLSTMSPAMYYNLEKLATSKFGKFRKTDGLKRELYHLRDIGYVKIKSISEIPEMGDQLSEHVSITDAGLTFVKLRKSILNELNQQNN